MEPFVIPPDFQPLIRPINTYQEWGTDNPRQGDVGMLSGLLLKYGQTVAAVVQKSTGRIVKGNHTHRAATMLGATVYAFNVMDLSDEEARAYLLADNAASDAATYDETALAQMARESFVAGYGEEWTGISGDDLDRMLQDTGELTVEEKPYHHDQAGFLDRFLNTTIRQLSMHFSSADYGAVVERLDRVMTVAKVPTHTDAFLFLLDHWEVSMGDALPALEETEEAGDGYDGPEEGDDGAAGDGPDSIVAADD